MKNFKIFFLLALIISAIQPCIAQTPMWVWATGSRATGIDREVVATDQAGNVFTSPYNAFSKFSPSGALLWSKQLPNLRVKAMKCDKLGNIYLGGTFTGTIQLDNVTLVPTNVEDIFLAKYSTSGSLLWAKKAGGRGLPPGTPRPINAIDEGIFSLSLDSLGNCFAVGICLSDTAQFGSIRHFSNYKPFVVKYDNAGNALWVRNLDKDPEYITVGLNGSYFVAGNWYDQNTGTYNVYLDKFAAAGTPEWHKEALGQNYIWDIASDKLGNCYISGDLHVSTSFDSFPLIPVNGGELFMVKYNTNGLFYYAVQTHVAASSGCSNATLALDSKGNVALAGAFKGTVNFPGSALSVTSAGITSTTDFLVVKYDSLGTPKWVKKAGSLDSDYSHAISMGLNGDCYVVGTTKTNCTFDNVVLTGPTSNLAFLAKLSANPLGISENQAASNFQLYPNPATSNVTVSAKDFKNGTVAIFNLTGQRIYETKLQPETTIATANWPAGIYVVKLSSGGKTLTQKLVVNP